MLGLDRSLALLVAVSFLNRSCESDCSLGPVVRVSVNMIACELGPVLGTEQ